HTAVTPPGAAGHPEPTAPAAPAVPAGSDVTPPPELHPAEAATGDAPRASSAAAPTAAATALRRLLQSNPLDDDPTTETDEDVLGDHLGDAATTGDALDADGVSSVAGRIPRVKPVWV